MAEAVRELNITKAVVDHPFSPFIDLSVAEMRELTSAGIYMNFTYDEISPLLGVNPADMAAAISGFDRSQQRIYGAVKKKQQQYLWQTGERILPKHVAKQNQGTSHQSKPLVE